jgi:hypothetical protein
MALHFFAMNRRAATVNDTCEQCMHRAVRSSEEKEERRADARRPNVSASSLTYVF